MYFLITYCLSWHMTALVHINNPCSLYKPEHSLHNYVCLCFMYLSSWLSGSLSGSVSNLRSLHIIFIKFYVVYIHHTYNRLKLIKLLELYNRQNLCLCNRYYNCSIQCHLFIANCAIDTTLYALRSCVICYCSNQNWANRNCAKLNCAIKLCPTQGCSKISKIEKPSICCYCLANMQRQINTKFYL